LKQGKQFLGTFLLLLAFLASSGINVLFAKSNQINYGGITISSNEKHSEPLYIFIQAINDNENEEDEIVFYTDAFQNCKVGVIDFSVTILKLPYHLYLPAYERNLWRLNENYRL